MLNKMLTLYRDSWSRSLLVLTLLMTSALFACSAVKEEAVLDRTSVPEARADADSNVSEIREIKFHPHKRENGEKVLHLQGQIFTKVPAGGSTQIRPCVGCTIKLLYTTDTAARANIITEGDGYFTFTGAIQFNTITVSSSGFNSIEISDLNLESGGLYTLKVVQAPGSAQERFSVSKNEGVFTWKKL